MQTEHAVENFPISGLHPWRAFIWSVAAMNRAAAEVNYDLDLFNDREVDGKKFTAKQLSDAITKAAQESWMGNGILSLWLILFKRAQARAIT